MNAGIPESVDTVISGALIVTLDAERRIIRDGSIAIRGDRIAAVGKRSQIERHYRPRRIIDGRRFLATPGFANGHIHITGDPLTRGYTPDDIDEGFAETLTRWVIPRFLAHTEEDEQLSAQLAAVQMLRSGTTCFLEAGTIRFLDAVVEGLDATGIRGRVGAWVEGRAVGAPDKGASAEEAAIRLLEDEVARFPAKGGARIAAWPILIGHSTNTDNVWKAAKSLADANGLGVSAHMSPFEADPEWFMENIGRRPMEHLAEIGVLGSNVSLAHALHISDRELEVLANFHANIILCPSAALKGAFGISSLGRYPEMNARGLNIALGTDGSSPDLMQEIGLVAAVFKDARRDSTLFPAHEALTMGTLNGARAMGLLHEIGSLEAGKKADLVLHDLERPEWRPLLNAVNQLVWSADGRAVHSVWVDGVQVVDDYRCTLIEEEALYSRAQAAGEALVRRSGVPAVSPWPVE